MQPAEKLFSDKKCTARQLRDEYLKTVNIKLISPSGHEQYVRQGCHHHPKVKASFAKFTLIHEPCQKPPKNDEGIETGNKSNLPNRDGSTDGKGCFPLELRRQYKLNHGHPAGARVRFASVSAVSEKRSKGRYASSSVKTPPQFEPLRDCIKELWEHNESYIHCGACEVHEQTPMHETVDKIGKSEFRRRSPTFPASTATTSISPEGIYFSAEENQFHESSRPSARSPERHSRRRAADSLTRRLEQHDHREGYRAKEKRTQADVAPAETPPPLKPMLACVYQEGDVFVIQPLSAVKDSN